MYYSMAPGGATGWFLPLINYHWTLVGNVKRDPFEQTVSFGDAKSAMALGGTLGSPSTAYLYDWNMLPIGQQLWEKELYSFKEFPPLQAPETYNLTGIQAEMEKHKGDD
jgi:arylsulfatase